MGWDKLLSEKLEDFRLRREGQELELLGWEFPGALCIESTSLLCNIIPPGKTCLISLVNIIYLLS